MTDIYALLCRLGITGNYTGFFYTAYALKLCAERREPPALLTKRLYPEVAARYGTNWKAVERDMRTIENLLWTKNRALLEKMAGKAVLKKPTTAKLLSMLLCELKKDKTAV